MVTADIADAQFPSQLATVSTSTDQGEGVGCNIAVKSSFFQVKELFERALAMLLLVPTAPVIAALVVLIRLNSRGPGIFRQARVGRGGRIFTMYKLRSMRIDAEAKTGPTWSPSGLDPRVTKLGYWIRRLHLDELPQLINVVRGEMSLIGPRPERPEFVHFLAHRIPGYLNRLAVHPGITGLAQINLPPDTDLESVKRKLTLDCEYIRSAGLFLDFRILICTALRMFWIKGPLVTGILGVDRLDLVHFSDEADIQPAGGPDAPVPVSLATLAAQDEQVVSRRHAAAPSATDRSAVRVE
jgi:lipopolysaccharide/colanic/teichoic acid biosynthesis glycosyltransferase